MAKVWPVFEGPDPTPAEAWADLPVETVVRVLELKSENYLGPLEKAPKFKPDRHNAWIPGYRQVVVEVAEGEANNDWRAGFYKSNLSPAESRFRLRVHRSLGASWCDEWENDLDADGEPALLLWVALKAAAPEDEWDQENRERIRSNVREVAKDIDLGKWVYVRFTKELEKDAAA